jgi:predicted Zn-dependent peptidase
LQGTHYTVQLPNGLTVVAEHIPSVRSAAFVFIIPAGAVTDPEEHQGAATVIEGLAYRGAGSRNSRELSDALDALGIHRGGGAELEYTTYGGSLLADDLCRALKLYADIIRRPHLPADQLPAEKALAVQKLERLEDSPTEKLFINLRRSYYRSTHGRTALGTAEGIQSLTADTVAADHARRHRPGGTILAVAGRFQWEELIETVRRCFGDWEGSGPSYPSPDATGRQAYLHLQQDTNQEQIGLMYPSITLGHPQYYDMRMAVRVLAGGMSARLFTEVREKRGLCYSVSAMPHAIKGHGALLAYAGTTPERCQETLDVLIAELRRLAEGVTEEELARAEVGVLSDLVMQSETSRARAGGLARDQFLLGQVRTMEEIRSAVMAVTPASIYQYLQDFPARDFTVATLGPQTLEVRE